MSPIYKFLRFVSNNIVLLLSLANTVLSAVKNLVMKIRLAWISRSMAQKTLKMKEKLHDFKLNQERRGPEPKTGLARDREEEPSSGEK